MGVDGATPALGRESEHAETHSKARGAAALCVALLILAGGTYAAMTCQVRKKKDGEARMEVTNLRDFEHRRDSSTPRRQSVWGHRRRSSVVDECRSINVFVGVELRNSATGGWHGVYNEHQLGTIPVRASENGDGGGGGMISSQEGHGVRNGDRDLLSQDMTSVGLMTPDGICEPGPLQRHSSAERQVELEEIEASVDNYVIGDMDADVSDEDLIKAYNDALALSIELDDQEVGFAMQGFGPEKRMT